MPEDQKPFIPEEVEREHPVDGVEIPVDKHVYINVVPGEMEEAEVVTLNTEKAKHGVVKEPEIGRSR